jgi:hypothetical protein
MDWYCDLYLGEKAKKKKDELIRKIKTGKTTVNTYVLTLPAGENNQLEILAVGELDVWYDRLHSPTVVGLACGKKEAIALVRQITEEVYQQTGDVKLRAYLQEKIAGHTQRISRPEERTDDPEDE